MYSHVTACFNAVPNSALIPNSSNDSTWLIAGEFEAQVWNESAYLAANIFERELGSF